MNDADIATLSKITAMEPGEIGIVEFHDFHYNQPYVFENGKSIPGFTLRYETYGRLNADRNNAILICHALSGDHHCAGIHSLNDRKTGWWNNLIGPGKAVDTNKFFVLCANVIGGCQGSTGPSSINPETGRPYGTSFPSITIRDMVRTQKLWLDSLGVPHLYAAIGGSMGGMQVLQFAIDYPDFVQRTIAMATTACESAMGIAFNEVGRQAIMRDPDWADGNYPPGGGPRVGLAIARMMAHITYLSDSSMDRKFGRKRVVVKGSDDSSRESLFQIQTYLRHQGKSFIDRFDANSYLYITEAIDQFDLIGSDTTDTITALENAFRPVKSRNLIIGFTSDWLFPPDHNRDIALGLLRAGKTTSYSELSTDLGHDSFLLESPQLYGLVHGFLLSQE